MCKNNMASHDIESVKIPESFLCSKRLPYWFSLLSFHLFPQHGSAPLCQFIYIDFNDVLGHVATAAHSSRLFLHQLTVGARNIQGSAK